MLWCTSTWHRVCCASINASDGVRAGSASKPSVRHSCKTSIFSCQGLVLHYVPLRGSGRCHKRGGLSGEGEAGHRSACRSCRLRRRPGGQAWVEEVEAWFRLLYFQRPGYQDQRHCTHEVPVTLAFNEGLTVPAYVELLLRLLRSMRRDLRISPCMKRRLERRTSQVLRRRHGT